MKNGLRAEVVSGMHRKKAVHPLASAGKIGATNLAVHERSLGAHFVHFRSLY